jgi:hypothetical protein
MHIPLERAPSALRADADILQALRAAGLSELDLHAQRVAMVGLEESMERTKVHDAERRFDRSVTNEQLDRENRVVVEILTGKFLPILFSLLTLVSCLIHIFVFFYIR